MYKYVRNILLSMGVAGLLVSPPVFAQEVLVPADNDTPVDRLREHCDSIHGTLRRLHTTDALLRVNIGQMYNGISVRLMARLNSRLALNRIDSTNLVQITSDFEANRTDFVSNYSKYEAALSNVIKGNCKTNPAKFYELLLVARDGRAALAESVSKMHTNISDYQVAVEQLQQELFSENTQQQEAADGAN